ncbi:MAG: glucan biosynthesis protein [Ottowia sp.]|nr:glucan biosynthesis protein [Ottowia sp.]
MMDRREFLAAAAAAALASGVPARVWGGVQLGASQRFSFDRLVEEARALAGREYEPPPAVAPAEILDAVDYDAWGAVRFDTDKALFANGPGRYPVTFFPLGRYFRTPVRVFVVMRADDGARARPVRYDAADFDIPPGNPLRQLPPDAGFAGFRLQESRLGDQGKLPWRSNDWAAFLGASYFRAIGALYQYGVSARGIAIDTAVAGVTEEFPRFSRFYLQTPQDDGPTVTAWAMLEGPSVTGAYRFVMTRDRAVLMDVSARLFLRRDVQRLGLAPLTSMYWFSETRKPEAVDWRPEVHDSDGLAMWTGAGEYIWRPLANPPETRVVAFADRAPRGFGLCQRDRTFDHYLDGVYYDRRPTLWVQPRGDWGPGAVQLLELPTGSEFDDNIAAMWVPAAAARSGNEYRLDYRLHWVDREPFAPSLARCRATRLGLAFPGDPGRRHVRRFAVAFEGGPLVDLAAGVQPEAVLSASRGRVQRTQVHPVPDDVAGHWRVLFDWTVADPGPVDLRLYLRLAGQPLTETWLYTHAATA